MHGSPCKGYTVSLLDNASGRLRLVGRGDHQRAFDAKALCLGRRLREPATAKNHAHRQRHMDEGLHFVSPRTW